MQCRCVVVGLASGMVGASESVLTYVPNFGGVSQSRAQIEIHLTIRSFSASESVLRTRFCFFQFRCVPQSHPQKAIRPTISHHRCARICTR